MGTKLVHGINLALGAGLLYSGVMGIRIGGLKNTYVDKPDVVEYFANKKDLGYLEIALDLANEGKVKDDLTVLSVIRKLQISNLEHKADVVSYHSERKSKSEKTLLGWAGMGLGSVVATGSLLGLVSNRRRSPQYQE